MPPEELLNMIRRRPFVPFRIHLTDGTVYEVRHPELVMVGHGFAVVGVPDRPEEPYIQRHESVALIYIVRLEPLATSAQAQ